jgi:hypothetical protein
MQPQPEYREISLADDPDAFVQRIFSEPPAPPFTYALQLDTGSNDMQAVAEYLTVVLVKAMGKLWGHGERQVVALATLTSENWALIGEYFASFGINVYYDLEEQAEPEPTRFIALGPNLNQIVLHRWADGALGRLFFDIKIPDV